MNSELNQNPFQQTKFSRDTSIKKIINEFSSFSQERLKVENKAVNIAGRIINRIRSFGSLIFADLADQNGVIQLKVQNENFSKIGIGDIIGVTGVVCKTNAQKDKQELSIGVEKFVILAKCQNPLPDTAHFKLKDTEKRFRSRYLDFIVNSKNREIFFVRHKVIQNIRRFLDQRGFIEIETPVLVSEASGAQAKPFITKHNRLHRDFYLRIATEIPLKKLLVGGFDKVYEIGRIFRNEGIDARHNPEFTSIEVYQAYENAEHMMNLTEELFHYLSEEVLKKEEFEFKLKEEEGEKEISHVISFQNPFRRISMVEAIKEHTNIDFSQINNLEEALELVQKHNLKLEKFQKSLGQIILAFFEEYVEKKLIQPTFIYDYPIKVSPLAKSKIDNEEIADRFELYIGGLEFANGYSELNDPIEQKKRFEEQTKQKELGNEEIASFDKEFLEALEYGMPPAGGLGIGIDRLIMLFTGQNSIKEDPKIKEILDSAFRKIEDENNLENIFPKIYANLEVDNSKLERLIDIYANKLPSLGDSDAIGQIYEYFLKEFALTSGQKGGEFYTPRCVVELLVNLIQPFKGRIYDPCCGSGGMFIKAIEFVNQYKEKNEIDLGNSKLKENGVAAVVMANNSVSSAKQEKKIRQKFIEENLIDGIVQLPDKLFYTTGISAEEEPQDPQKLKKEIKKLSSELLETFQKLETEKKEIEELLTKLKKDGETSLYKNSTIVVITDRNALDEQITKKFRQVNLFFNQEIVAIENRKDLQETLKKKKQGGIIFHTIQKGDRLTATPIEDNDRSTFQVFGPIIHHYTREEAVEDKLTVKIICYNQFVPFHKEKTTVKGIFEDDEYLAKVIGKFYQHYLTVLPQVVCDKAIIVAGSKVAACKMYQLLQERVIEGQKNILYNKVKIDISDVTSEENNDYLQEMRNIIEQTVMRVNRRYPSKRQGIIVDFVGLGKNLKKINTIINYEELSKLAQEALQELEKKLPD
nr:11758_t:CDS:2 [Entrophospora candida]